MHKDTQAKLYLEMMGAEAADRQAKLADKCKECRALPGNEHATWCRTGLRVKAKAEQTSSYFRRRRRGS